LLDSRPLPFGQTAAGQRFSGGGKGEHGLARGDLPGNLNHQPVVRRHLYGLFNGHGVFHASIRLNPGGNSAASYGGVKDAIGFNRFMAIGGAVFGQSQSFTVQSASGRV
jgi:hypothetical protein